MSRLALLPLVLVLAACAADPRDPHGALPAPVVADGKDFTRRYEVRFEQDGDVAGYLVEYLRVPTGVLDERLYQEGCAVVQDARLRDVGFVSAAGAGYRFDGQGGLVELGFAARKAHVATLLGGSGSPILGALPGAP